MDGWVGRQIVRLINSRANLRSDRILEAPLKMIFIILSCQKISRFLKVTLFYHEVQIGTTVLAAKQFFPPSKSVQCSVRVALRVLEYAKIPRTVLQSTFLRSLLQIGRPFSAWSSEPRHLACRLREKISNLSQRNKGGQWLPGWLLLRTSEKPDHVKYHGTFWNDFS